jgi:hypothetical protein
LLVRSSTQGVALGWFVPAFQAEERRAADAEKVPDTCQRFPEIAKNPLSTLRAWDNLTARR